jgi:hypothetical protein
MIMSVVHQKERNENLPQRAYAAAATGAGEASRGLGVSSVATGAATGASVEAAGCSVAGASAAGFSRGSTGAGSSILGGFSSTLGGCEASLGLALKKSPTRAERRRPILAGEDLGFSFFSSAASSFCNEN